MSEVKKKRKKRQRDQSVNWQAWSPAEYAARYGVCRATVYAWMERGMLSSVKIGGARRILRKHDEDFLRNHPEESENRISRSAA